jgi:hypothetical protein
MNQLRQIYDAMAGSKVTLNKAAQLAYANLANKYLPIVGLPLIKPDEDVPSRLGGIAAMFKNSVGGSTSLPGGGSR